METNNTTKMLGIMIVLSIMGAICFAIYSSEELSWRDKACDIPINQIELYDVPGKSIGTYRYKVIEPHSDGYALAVELRRLEFAPLDSPTTNTVMIHNPYNRPYYRDEIIKIPKDSCARQIGICKVGYSINTLKIIPLVEIMQ